MELLYPKCTHALGVRSSTNKDTRLLVQCLNKRRPKINKKGGRIEDKNQTKEEKNSVPQQLVQWGIVKASANANGMGKLCKTKARTSLIFTINNNKKQIDPLR